MLKIDSSLSPNKGMKKSIEDAQLEEVGNVSMKDNLDDRVDKKLMDRILFNKKIRRNQINNENRRI